MITEIIGFYLLWHSYSLLFNLLVIEIWSLSKTWLFFVEHIGINLTIIFILLFNSKTIYNLLTSNNEHIELIDAHHWIEDNIEPHKAIGDHGDGETKIKRKVALYQLWKTIVFALMWAGLLVMGNLSIIYWTEFCIRAKVEVAIELL